MTQAGISFAQKVFTSIAIVLGVTGLAVFLITARQIFLLVFAAILMAVVMTGVIDAVVKRIPMSRGAALIALVILIIAAFGLLGRLLAPNLIEQSAELWQRLPQAWEQLTDRLRQFAWMDRFFAEAPRIRALVPEDGEMFFTRVLGVFSTLFGIVGSLLVVFFMAIFLAWEPQAYTENLLRLMGKSKRDRIREVLLYTAHMLRLWMLGKLIAMVAIGFFTALGLKLLQVPLALTLGLIAGILNFIPYLGPLLAFVPIFLIALVEGPPMVLYVAILYTVIQSLESYVLVPLVERKIIRLPPAFLLSTQIFLVLYLGALGLFLATPLIVAAVIMVKMLYIDDVLDDKRDDDRIP